METEMLFSTKNVTAITWKEEPFKIRGIILGNCLWCTISEELGYFGKSTGKWWIKYTLRNDDDRPFGSLANSEADAKEKAQKFLETFITMATKNEN